MPESDSNTAQIIDHMTLAPPSNAESCHAIKTQLVHHHQSLLNGLDELAADHYLAADIENLGRRLALHFAELPILLEDHAQDYEAEAVLDGICYMSHRALRRIRNRIHEKVAEINHATRELESGEIDDLRLAELEDKAKMLQRDEQMWQCWQIAAETVYTETTAKAWLPPPGKDRFNLGNVTAAVLSGANYAQQRLEQEKMARGIPADAKIIVVTGAPGTWGGATRASRSATVWQSLDAIKEKLGEFVIFHGGAKGPDLWAGAWATQNKTIQVVFQPDWQRDGKAAGYRRNDRMLSKEKITGIVAFPGNAGTAHLIGLARAAGIPIWSPCASRAAAAKLEPTPQQEPTKRVVNVKKLGGGWYLLPSGEKLHGRKAVQAHARAIPA
jgi:hypothetical protein